MAFLNDLGKMLGETGKTAAGRVKDMSSAIQLRAKVSAEQDSRDKAFMAIGKKIFEQHAAVFEDEFAAEFRTISEASQRIRDLEARISELEGTRVCPECGARVARGAKFCSSCGAPMEDFPKGESAAKEPRAEEAGAENPAAETADAHVGQMFSAEEHDAAEPSPAEEDPAAAGAAPAAGSPEDAAASQAAPAAVNTASGHGSGVTEG
jgi:hypothetical protein